MAHRIGITLTAVIAWLSLATTTVLAQEYDLAGFDSATPSVEDFIAALIPAAAPGSDDGQTTPPLKRAIPLRIQFVLDSYQLTAATRESLNNLGTALVSDPLSASRFRIEGHTEPRVDPAYRPLLAQQRIEGMRNYLINIFAVDPDRLESLPGVQGQGDNPDQPSQSPGFVVWIVNLGPVKS